MEPACGHVFDVRYINIYIMKKGKYIYLILLTLISFVTYAQKSDSISMKLTGRLVGKWQIQSTSRAGRDHSNSDQTQFIKFTLDAKYIWTNGKTLLDSGTYNTNEPQSEIYLQSARDKDHLQEWIINMKTNTSMSMIAKKASKGDGTRYEMIKVK
jgi:hypothetical protein